MLLFSLSFTAFDKVIQERKERDTSSVYFRNYFLFRILVLGLLTCTELLRWRSDAFTYPTWACGSPENAIYHRSVKNYEEDNKLFVGSDHMEQSPLWQASSNSATLRMRKRVQWLGPLLSISPPAVTLPHTSLYSPFPKRLTSPFTKIMIMRVLNSDQCYTAMDRCKEGLKWKQ
jgi:hypothetical protein